MSVDLETTEGRKKYLSDKLDDLLDGINESYGSVLMQELINRLELTIMDFNNEMKVLCEELAKKQEERLYLLEMLQSKNSVSKKSTLTDATNSDDELIISSENSEKSDLDIIKDKSDIPIWEKKLAKLEKNKK
tara:strand:- start:280 stop:678 length:399 start_codon:yes stop_codon:yes gene_type:complete